MAVHSARKCGFLTIGLLRCSDCSCKSDLHACGLTVTRTGFPSVSPLSPQPSAPASLGVYFKGVRFFRCEVETALSKQRTSEAPPYQWPQRHSIDFEGHHNVRRGTQRRGTIYSSNRFSCTENQRSADKCSFFICFYKLPASPGLMVAAPFVLAEVGN